MASVPPVDAGAARSHAPPSLATLPLPVQNQIWVHLPVDTRLRCREVCVAWRDSLNDASLALDLSPASGVAHAALAAMPRTGSYPNRHSNWDDTLSEAERREAEAEVRRERLNLLFSAAAARAGGRLRSVDVSDCFSNLLYRLSLPLLREVLRGSADTLRTLRLLGGEPHAGRMPRVAAVESFDVLSLLRAAPRLECVDADVEWRGACVLRARCCGGRACGRRCACARSCCTTNVGPTWTTRPLWAVPCWPTAR